MKYLCLVYLEEKMLDALSRSEFDGLVGESLAYDEELPPARPGSIELRPVWDFRRQEPRARR